MLTFIHGLPYYIDLEDHENHRNNDRINPLKIQRKGTPLKYPYHSDLLIASISSAESCNWVTATTLTESCNWDTATKPSSPSS